MIHRCTHEQWHWLAECIARSERPDLAARFDRRHVDAITSFYEPNWKITFLPPNAEDFSNVN
jgi:hypothetical protein